MAVNSGIVNHKLALVMGGLIALVLVLGMRALNPTRNPYLNLSSTQNTTDSSNLINSQAYPIDDYVGITHSPDTTQATIVGTLLTLNPTDNILTLRLALPGNLSSLLPSSANPELIETRQFSLHSAATIKDIASTYQPTPISQATPGLISAFTGTYVLLTADYDALTDQYLITAITDAELNAVITDLKVISTHPDNTQDLILTLQSGHQLNLHKLTVRLPTFKLEYNTTRQNLDYVFEGSLQSLPDFYAGNQPVSLRYLPGASNGVYFTAFDNNQEIALYQIRTHTLGSSIYF